MKSLAIFDLDGTLLNTITDLGNAANHALKEMGFPTHHISSYPHFVGGGITNLLKNVAPSADITENDFAELKRLFIEYYDSHLADNTLPYPGIPELLKELADRNVALAVASNKYQIATVALVRHFFHDLPWVAVEGQKPDVPVKPDPSIVFEILSEYPTPKAEVIYIGDSAVDIETARRAAIDSISVTWGFRTVGELVAAYADNIVDSPRQIIEIIDKHSVR